MEAPQEEGVYLEWNGRPVDLNAHPVRGTVMVILLVGAAFVAVFATTFVIVGAILLIIGVIVGLMIGMFVVFDLLARASSIIVGVLADFVMVVFACVLVL